jgi:hypothetical protein
MGFWLVTSAFLLAVAALSWRMPTHPKVRWLLPSAAAVVGVLLLTPRRSILLPMIACYGPTDCHMTGTTYQTLVGLSIPGSDRLGYDGTVLLALGVALGAAILSFALLLYRATARSR